MEDSQEKPQKPDEDTQLVVSIPSDKPVKRDEKGYFLKGTKGGPGNPYNKETAQIRALLFDKITKKDWQGIREALIDKCLAGDVKAMTLLFSYILGKPVQSLDINMTAAAISKEEAQSRIKTFFGL